MTGEVFCFITELVPGLVEVLGVGDGEGVELGVGVGIGVDIELGVGVGVGVGVGFLIATPLFQTNFFPFFMQVYFLPW